MINNASSDVNALFYGKIRVPTVYEDLIARCKENDRAAQEELYNRFFRKMLTVCLRYVSDREDALEVLNDGFISVFKNLGQYQSKGSFEGWIRRIMVNKSLDFIRSRKSYNENITLEKKEYEDVLQFNDALGNLGIEELYKMIESLPPMSKAVFNMYAIDGFSHKEIANEMSISENTSRWHLHEARNQLQEQLRKVSQYDQQKYDQQKNG
jgi:RNA polymerase sigma-70 factor (ECF subfamily)